MQDDYRIQCVGTACDYVADSTLEEVVPAECPQCHNGLGARPEKQILVRVSGRDDLHEFATPAQQRAWAGRSPRHSFEAVNRHDDGAEAFWVPVVE